MKRYKIQTNYSLGCNAKMIESDGGEWIRYSDYLKEKEEIKDILYNSIGIDILKKRLADALNVI